MQCPRCTGLMVRERLAWMDEPIALAACVNCGNRLDEMILENHRHPPVVNDPVACEDERP